MKLTLRRSLLQALTGLLSWTLASPEQSSLPRWLHQPHCETLRAVKQEAVCLSRRAKACVSLWGIPLPHWHTVFTTFLFGLKRWCGWKEERRRRGSTREKKHLCKGCVRVFAHDCVCVRCASDCSEASGGHAHFQLASLLEVHKHTLGKQKSSFGKAQTSDTGRHAIRKWWKCSSSWECGEVLSEEPAQLWLARVSN